MKSWARLVSTVSLALAVAAACTAPSPSVDLVHVLHLDSRISQAVVVSVTGVDGQHEYLTALRPCGGALDLAVGREIPADGDWIIALSIDASGQFDRDLAAWTGDPHAMPGQYSVLPIWSSMEIHAADLPKWVSVGTTDPILADAPAAGPIQTPCPTRGL